MQREYNFIFEKLVNSDEDIIGNIAYSLYKKHKIQYIKKFKEKNNNKPPTDKELTKFHDHSSLGHSIESYKLKAEEITLKFTKNTLKKISSEIENDCKKNQHRLLIEIVKPIKPSFWKNVLAGLVSALIFTGLITIIALYLQTKGSTIEINFKKDNPKIYNSPDN